MAQFTSNSSSTATIMELPTYPSAKEIKPYVTPYSNFNSGRSISEIDTTAPKSPSSHRSATPEGTLPSPTTARPQLSRWNYPRSNIMKVFACFFSFIILGANDGAYGALIPYLEEYYNVNYTVISLIFLSPVVGYVCSASSNNMIHMKVGQRGIAIIMSLCHMTGYVLICIHPPFPVLVIVFVLTGFGSGLGDSAWNAWIGDMANANEVLGFLHAFYGLGAALAPLIATTVITRSGWEWYQFYYLMLGGSVLELIFLTTTFWKNTGAVYRAANAQIEPEHNSGTATPDHTRDSTRQGQTQLQSKRPWYVRINPFMDPKSGTAQAVKHKVTLEVALFLIAYVGAEVSIGGWIVTFMLRVRDASPFASGLTSTGFWLGIVCGRLILGFVTARVFKSEKQAVATYLTICVALQLLVWLVPKFLVSAVMVGLLGFFLGPMFPAAVVVLTKLLPKRLHVPAVGFVAAFGASGACIVPFATGAIANAKGVQVLQPIVLALLVVLLGVWLIIPKLPKQRLA